MRHSKRLARFKRFLTPINALCLAIVLTGVSLQTYAWEPEALYQEYRAKHSGEWREQEAQIDDRLGALYKKYGKRPNIIYILADDIGWGELGSYGGGKVRGTPTPNLDDLAKEGMKFLSHYAEPICTPTRVALMSGRLPVRTGLDVVLFPGQTKGLVAEEYTLAELLSDAGYKTAMFGKWHVGEMAEHQPTNQGFDYAYYTLYNGGVWPWTENAQYFDASNETIGEIPYQMDAPKDYAGTFGIEIYGILEARKGGPIREVAPLSLERYNIHDNELTDKVLEFIEKESKADSPFFVYFASNANQVFACPQQERTQKYVDSGNCQAAQLAQHDKNVKRIHDKLRELKIEENTLLVWMSDNGPMYVYFPSAGYSWLRGQKGDVYEGGVRTPAIASWPGIIEPGQDPMNLIHVTDWYTTAARVAGAMDKIPDDRVVDGIDQTPTLFYGEEMPRRNYIFHYERGSDPKDLRSGMKLGALRYENIKYHVNKGEYYNIIRDPGEKFSSPDPYLWAIIPFAQIIERHKEQMTRFPNRILPTGVGLSHLEVLDHK